MMEPDRPRRRAWALAFASAVALASGACGGDSSAPVRARSEGLELEASLTPAAPRVGENALTLTLRDAQGKTVSGAHVAAAVRMHAMGAMPAMGGPASVRELGDGRYQADFGLDMGGTWQVEISAHAAGGRELRAEGSLVVGSEGLRLAAASSEGRDADASAESKVGEGESPGAFSFPEQRIQKIGVRTARAELRPLARTVRATARVTFDESALVDVSPRISGWIESLAVEAVGDPVARGQTLLTLYSPELYATQLEYQQALASRSRATGATRPERAEDLVRAAERRLALLGVASADLAAIAERSEPLRAVPLRAPASGVVIEKAVLLGASVSAGDRLLRIAPSDRIWLEAAIAESDLPLVSEGDAVRVTLAGDPRAATLAGTIVRVLPELSADSRTATARIALAPPGVALRPDMWASVAIDAAAGEGLVVPASAVLRAGERSFVFVAEGGGRFAPREVALGLEMADAVEVRSGLEPGERIVSEGTYLVASESRLRAAISQW